MKSFLKIFGIMLLISLIGTIIILLFSNDQEYTKSFYAKIEDCRVLHTEFERSHNIYLGNKTMHFSDNWKIIVFNIKLQKNYYLNFSENPHLVNDSIYKFVILY